MTLATVISWNCRQACFQDVQLEWRAKPWTSLEKQRHNFQRSSKSSIFIGFSITVYINHPFGGSPILGTPKWSLHRCPHPQPFLPDQRVFWRAPMQFANARQGKGAGWSKEQFWLPSIPWNIINVGKTMSYTTHLGMVYTTYGDFGDDLLLFYPHYSNSLNLMYCTRLRHFLAHLGKTAFSRLQASCKREIQTYVYLILHLLM